MKLPDGLENAPELLPGLDVYWTAYHALHTCRPLAWGTPGPIPWTAVAHYAQVWEMDEVQMARLERFVGKMDSEFLSWYGRTHGN